MMNSNRKSKRQFGMTSIAMTPLVMVLAGITIYSIHRVELEKVAAASLESAPLVQTDNVTASFERSLNREFSDAPAAAIRQADPVASLIRERILDQHNDYQ